MKGIRHIKKSALDADKWNACIDAAPNGLIYAYTFYLDAMCDNWEALVLNDYEAVMPLPWRKKWGISYVYTPAFIQQLGVFGPAVNKELTEQFLKKGEELFRFGDYFINYANHTNRPQRTNFVLDLNQPYEQLYKGFATDLKNNLKKAAKQTLHYKPIEDFQKAISVYRQLYQSKIGHVTGADFEKFTLLCQQLHKQKMLCIREVRNSKEELLAIALCTKDDRRLYLLASSTTAEGRVLKATHFLLNRLIQEFANTPALLDFEGSDLPGVKYFYANFGAVNQPYFFYHWNKLPWPLKLLK